MLGGRRGNGVFEVIRHRHGLHSAVRSLYVLIERRESQGDSRPALGKVKFVRLNIIASSARVALAGPRERSPSAWRRPVT
jgi:hypothetical protein